MFDYVNVILPLPLADSYTYHLPDELIGQVAVGCRVLVPFGTKKTYAAMIVEVHDRCPEGYVVKDVLAQLDEQPIILPSQLELWRWIADYYLCTLGEVYKAALPGGFEDYKPRTVSCVRITDEYFSDARLQELQQRLLRYPQQLMVMSCYAEQSALTAAARLQNKALLKEVMRQELLETNGLSASSLQTLCKNGVLEVYQREVSRLAFYAFPDGILTHPLSPAQQHAKEEINAQWQSHSVCLLQGVTGSGKTEIYIQLIQEALARGEQVLYLLPEIVLTTQLTERLRRVFGSKLGVYHSRYSDAERVEVYQKMLSESPFDIIVGVRSSVFLPFRKLGLVIVDEEHETSFRQADPAPRYHGRNVALVLAARHKARTLLGTATPSLESYYNAQRGKYGFVQLSTRYRDVALPQVEVVDMRDVKRKRLAEGPFSPRMIAEIDKALEGGRQAILFLNRRGYSPVMECQVCGWVPRCQRCDVSLTFHRSMRQMTCHYCGANYSLPDRCPQCDSTDLRSCGYGTERIEQVLQARFPNARIARMDLDTTRSRQAYEQILRDFQRGQTDILVGTQMVVKGLDFDKVSMVGIIDASAMLRQPDFRSYERAFNMMEQVAGRAGRKEQQGIVILQTMDANEPLIQHVVHHDYPAMYAQQMLERQQFAYPPFCHLVYIVVKHRDEHLLDLLTTDFANQLRAIFGQRVLGPNTPYVSRVQHLYIRHLILKIELGASMAEARRRLREVQQQIIQNPRYKSAQVYYEVD